MNDGRNYASLSSGLLARKGTAKPAMRPQGFTGFEDLGWNDMGYDPVADQPAPPEIPEHVPSSIAALTPAPRPGESRQEPVFEDEEPESELDAEMDDHEDIPSIAHIAVREEDSEDHSVVGQQRAILQRFDGEEEAEAEEAFAEGAEPAAIVPAKKARAEKAQILPLPKRAEAAVAATRGRKSAFTLRLDSDRHLRLRLACAVTGRSAQQIVTGALDAALAEIPEIEALAARVPAKAGSTGAKRN
jgi:hypothetical protein